ncbi:TNT domain-containing protein [Acinetobacter gerneri]|uniref:TNT domain-containing protein n=1 Tax=Acinetobacter gerneri TaxID=202952 RepID=UPI003A84E72C
MPFENRALPSSSLNKPYTQYEVVQPIQPVAESKILPWFGQPGQGIQYKLPKTVEELLDSSNPYLKEIINDKK